MNRRFILLVCGFLVLTLLLPFQAAAAVTGSETLLYRFGGTILDFDASRIVWRETGGKVLWLYNRTDGSQVKIHDATGVDYTIDRTRLSAECVVFSLSGWPLLTQYWKDGAVRKIGEGHTLYDAKGNFAVISSSVVDLTTGESRSLPSSYYINGGLDLSANGMVVYTSRTYQSNLYKSLPDGTLTTYVPPSPNFYTYSGALTDGNNVIYKVLMWYNGSYSKWSLRVRSADDQITLLALNPFEADYFADPRNSYQINNGWIAYKEYNKEIERWILYVRSPEGVTKQVYVTPYWWDWRGVPLSIKQLGPDGTVAYTFKDTTYISTQEGKLLYSSSSPGEIEYREHVFTGPGGNEYRYGAWYRLAGGSLYGINLS